MRALGPGSVSSILKVILDVVYYALWVAGVVAAVLAIFAFVAAATPGAPHVAGAPVHVGVGASDAFGFACFALYCLGMIVVVGRLRAFFATLTAGDPFHPDNVTHLRIIALSLAVLEVGQYGAAAIASVAHIHLQRSWGFNPTLWFAVLVISVLAEVFREGARLRSEAELTI